MKTVNSYVPDAGEVVITLSAANVAALTGYTTAEAIVISGVVRTFERTNNPERQTVHTKVTGSQTPIVTASNQRSEAEKWKLVIVDDYHSGKVGEWGTDGKSAYQIFYDLWQANQDPTSIQGTPNGGNTGDIETSLTTPTIKSVGEPKIDADANNPATVEILIEAPTSTKAAHS